MSGHQIWNIFSSEFPHCFWQEINSGSEMFYTEKKGSFILAAVGMLWKKEEGEDARGTSSGDSYKVKALANIFRASNHM